MKKAPKWQSGHSINDTISPDQVFGSGQRWFFWDENREECCGPFDSKSKAFRFCEEYGNTITECEENV